MHHFCGDPRLLAEDVLACPDYDHKSVEWYERARWSVERQEFVLEGDLQAGPNCVGCGRYDLAEEAVFLTPARIAAAAIETLAPRPVPNRALDYRCACCGDPNIILSVMVARDPILGRDVFRNRLPSTERCPRCGSFRVEEVVLGVKDRVEVARAFARQAKENAAAVKTLRKLTAFLAR